MSDPTTTAAAGRLTPVRVTAEELASSVRRELAADEDSSQTVVWTDGDAEVVLYPERLRAALRPGLVLLEARLAADQTGAQPAPLTVPFSVGKGIPDAALFAVTEEVPRGDPLLAARWGTLVQDALWLAILRTGESRRPPAATRTPPTLLGLYAESDALTYLFGPPVTADDVARELGSDTTPSRPAGSRGRTQRSTGPKRKVKRAAPSRRTKSEGDRL